jgi:hypothetical protein
MTTQHDPVNNRITEILTSRQGERLEREAIEEIRQQLMSMLAASPRVIHAAEALRAWNLDQNTAPPIRQPLYEAIVRVVIVGLDQYDTTHPATTPADRPDDKRVPCPVEPPDLDRTLIEGTEAGQVVVINALIMCLTTLRYFAGDRVGKQFSVGDSRVAENRAAWCKRTLDMLATWGWLPRDHDITTPYQVKLTP